MLIRIANESDIDIISKHDRWINVEEISNKVSIKQIYVAYSKNVFIGWLRYNLFWDNVPYMSILHLLPKYRGKGYGRKLVEQWETDMKDLGYTVVLTSTAQTETAQHFYDKLGYKAIGSFTLANEPLEIIFSKNI